MKLQFLASLAFGVIIGAQYMTCKNTQATLRVTRASAQFFPFFSEQYRRIWLFCFQNRRNSQNLKGFFSICEDLGLYLFKFEQIAKILKGFFN